MPHRWPKEVILGSICIVLGILVLIFTLPLWLWWTFLGISISAFGVLLVLNILP